MRRMPLAAIVVLAGVTAARPAAAGMLCTSDDGTKHFVALIEAAAKDKAALDAARAELAFTCVEFDAKPFAKRLAAACQTILDRDGDTAECMRDAAAAGSATLGQHDVFGWIRDHVSENPIDEDPLFGLGKLELLAAADPARALPVVLDTWRAAIPRAAAREQHHGEMASWSAWRQRAAKVLGDIGGKDEIGFLTEQAKATRDAYVAQACRDAIAAIGKRVAKP